MMEGRVSIQDFTFASEVKLGTYSDSRLPPAGAVVAARRIQQDPRAEPQYGERVAYVIAQGPPGMTRTESAVSPEALLADRSVTAFYHFSLNKLY